MRLTLVLGGARSGKTRWALEESPRRRSRDLAGGGFRGRCVDGSGGAAQKVEESRNAARALEAAVHPVVVLDCLTMLLSRHVADAASESAAEAAGDAAVRELLDAAGRRMGELVIVANEVGQGVVPAHPSGRWFRDVQGRANQRVAADAGRVLLVVAGLPLWLKDDD